MNKRAETQCQHALIAYKQSHGTLRKIWINAAGIKDSLLVCFSKAASLAHGIARLTKTHPLPSESILSTLHPTSVDASTALSPPWRGDAIWQALEILIQAQILIGSVCGSDFLSWWGMLMPCYSLVSATLAAGNGAVGSPLLLSLTGSVSFTAFLLLRLFLCPWVSISKKKSYSLHISSMLCVLRDEVLWWVGYFLNSSLSFISIFWMLVWLPILQHRVFNCNM